VVKEGQRRMTDLKKVALIAGRAVFAYAVLDAIMVIIATVGITPVRMQITFLGALTFIYLIYRYARYGLKDFGRLPAA
jgi:hypothetical protein